MTQNVPASTQAPAGGGCCGEDHDHDGLTGAEIVAQVHKTTRLIGLAALVAALAAFGLLAVRGLSVTGLLFGLSFCAVSYGLSAYASQQQRRFTQPRQALIATLAWSLAPEVVRVIACVVLVRLVSDDGAAIWNFIAVAVALPLALYGGQQLQVSRTITSPSAANSETINALLHRKITGTSAVILGAVSSLCGALWTIGATLLVALAPVLAIATLMFRFSAAIAGHVVAQKDPAQRDRTPLAYAFPALSILIAIAGLAAWFILG